MYSPCVKIGLDEKGGGIARVVVCGLFGRWVCRGVKVCDCFLHLT